ncbi:uncharacterized protein LOC121803643 [Salvia splendens]|uniref:uncharacterized protein LOC121803643 n=1 Tax=Salvia splendens TaxID=180675 RepID=UPI001C26351A|nr:uncharacterized protein LOC121803643 [Salvia splendens]
MARQHITFRNQQFSNSYLGFGVGSLILCALALFMCASHSRRRWRHWKSCYGYGKQDPIIQLNHEEIMDYQLGDVEPSSEGTLWKKNIMMGGKCQLPDFSGVIIYDSTGTVVTPATNHRALPALTWK